jgi:hypothetical protein
MAKPPELEQGLYRVGQDGVLTSLDPGAYSVDEDGFVQSGVDWQGPVNRIPWEKVDTLLASWNQRASTERIVTTLATYLLVALVLALAGALAWRGIIEGQALVGLLGAIVGYLLARGRSGLAASN